MIFGWGNSSMKIIIPMTATMVPLHGDDTRFKIVAIDAAGRIRNRIINRSWSRSGAYAVRKRFQKSIDEGLVGASCLDCGKHCCTCKRTGITITSTVKNRSSIS